MESHEIWITLGGATAVVVLYELFAGWLLLLLGKRWEWIGRRLPKPANFCPRCEHLALEKVFEFEGISDPPTPKLYLCQHCGARWKRFFTRPLEESTDDEYNGYADPDAYFREHGLPDNGKDPMVVTPFEPNWVKCPNCGWRFRLDHESRSGNFPLHASCGQRLIITNNESQ